MELDKGIEQLIDVIQCTYMLAVQATIRMVVRVPYLNVRLNRPRQNCFKTITRVVIVAVARDRGQEGVVVGRCAIFGRILRSFCVP